MTQIIDFKEIIQQGILLIQQWSTNQPLHVKETQDYIDLERVIKEIEQENDFSLDSYEDIRFVLRPFDEIIPLKIKRIFNLSTMDYYTMFIATRHFKEIDDYINLILGIKRFRFLLEKYHYNPIPLNKTTSTFFPNIQTYHIYEENEEYIEGGKISQYYQWNDVLYSYSVDIRQKYPDKKFEFKKVIWTADDTEKYVKKQLPEGVDIENFEWRCEMVIPSGVNEIDKESFDKYDDCFSKIIIPTTVKIISPTLFKYCENLTNITLPLKESEMIIGNKIFRFPHFDQVVSLPFSIKVINGKNVNQLTSLYIPTTVTSISEECFLECTDLKELHISDTVVSNPKNFIHRDMDITNLTIPLNENQMICGNKIFTIKDEFDQFVYLSNSIKIINDNEIETLTSIIIPSTVTSIAEKCFDNCFDIKQIIVPETVKEIHRDWLVSQNNLTNITIPIRDNQIICGNKIFNVPHFDKTFYLPTTIQIINGKEVEQLTSLEIPTTVTSLEDNCFSNTYRLLELKIPDTIKMIPKQCLTYCRSLTNITLPIHETQFVFDHIIFSSPHLKNVISLPDSIKLINGNKVNLSTTFLIPSTVTSIDDYCFPIYTLNILELIIPSTIELISMKSIENINFLKKITFPLNDSQIILGNKLFKNNNSHLEPVVYLPTTLVSFNDKEIDYKMISIPTIITSLHEDCFKDFERVEQLIIPDSVKTIPKHCIENLEKLTNITLPLNDKLQLVIGNKIFNKSEHFEQYIYLPSSIEVINETELNQTTSLEIPTYVTSLNIDCFYRCYSLEVLTIPESVKCISKNVFANTTTLKSLTIPQHFKPHDDRLFYSINDCLYSVELPTSITKINNKEIQMQSLQSFSIPSNITKLSDKCFANCVDLTELKGLKQIQDIGKYCFYRCYNLNENIYPQVEQFNKNYWNEIVPQEEKELLEQWTEQKCLCVYFDTNIDDWSENISMLNERFLRKRKVSFIIEDEDGDKFGFYVNIPLVKTNSKKDGDYIWIDDEESFLFKLRVNGSLKQSMKFEKEKTSFKGYYSYHESSEGLIKLGNIELMKENRKHKSFYYKVDDFYNDFENSKNSTKRKISRFKTGFIPRRFVVIQMV